MKMRTIGPSFAARAIAWSLALTLAAGCAAGNRLLPLSNSPGGGGGQTSPEGVGVKVLVRMRVPRQDRKHRQARPSSISSLTRSVSIAVNAGKAQIFNTTPSSPGCRTGDTGLTCTFAVNAKAGTDTFTVTTFSGKKATGRALDRGIEAEVPIKAGKTNKVIVTLGPLVTTKADGGVGSLRYAVATANSGDTVTFQLATGSTIVLASPITVTGNVVIAGPGTTKLAISGNGSHQLFLVAGSATISGLTLTRGKAATPGNPGGAIANAGALTLASDAFGSNTSIVAARRARAPGKKPAFALRTHGLHPHCTTTPVEGGAIYNDGALTISGTTFTNNVIQSNVALCLQGEGGAIYNDVYGSLTSTGDTYSGNSAFQGGAVYNGAAGAAVFTKDSFTANYTCTAASGCPTSGCTATACTSAAAGAGGAIFDFGTGITVVDSTFTGNVAGGRTPGSDGAGGAILLESVLPTVTGSTFTANLAGGGTTSCSMGEGGAIAATNPVELDNDTFKNNAATGDDSSGGGAVIAVMTINGTGDTFSGNSATGAGGQCTSDGSGIGGAVYAMDSATFSNSTFTGNSASGNQTGIAGGLATANNGTVANCTFTSNTALATGTSGATNVTAAAGALLATNIGKVSASTFTSNGATLEGPSPNEAFGGALASGTLISTGNTFTSNFVKEKTGSALAAGGAVGVLTASLISTGDKFSSNTATSTGTAAAGALIAEDGGLISNATFSSNSASGPQSIGGAMASVSSFTQLRHVTFTANSASGGGGTMGAIGGGLYDEAGGTIADSSFTGNKAATAGGGIAAATAETLENSIVSNNTVTKASIASSGGGGIFENSGLTLTQTTVAGNTVTVSGAGPAGGGGVMNGGGLAMTQSTISGNKVLGSAALHSGGGGVLSNSDFNATNSTISNNSSTIDGGGVEIVSNSTVELDNATLFANTATHNGGNIDNLFAMTLTNSVVGGGNADVGKDVDNAGTLTSGDYNVVQTAPAGTGFTGTTTHNVIANPQLSALADNGGPTFTNADKATSPGKGHIPFVASKCGSVPIAQDQRGYTRGKGGVCDSGAFEFAGVATAAVHRPALPKHRFHRHGRSAGAALKLKPLKLPKPF